MANMFSLEEFQSQISDIARPYHWEVIFSGGCFDGLGKEQVKASMRTASIPGVSVNPVAVSYFGMIYNIAGTPTYEPMAAQFIIDHEYAVMDEWRSVMDKVYTYETGEGPTWHVPDDYMGEMTLTPLDTNKGATSKYILKMAWLSNIGIVSYGHETKDTPLVFDATITYSYFNKE